MVLNVSSTSDPNKETNVMMHSPQNNIQVKMETGSDIMMPSPGSSTSPGIAYSPGNGYSPTSIDYQFDPLNSRVNKKKGLGTAGKSIEEELCLICGDRASGYHYNALSCEGCKGFFRRSVTRGASYVCKNGGNCEMDMWMRRRCQACRLRICREVGMKEECLLSEEQCKARDARRKSRQLVVKRKNSIEQQPSPDSNSVAIEQELALATGNPLDQLADEYRQLVEKVVLYQDQFELPSKGDVEKITQVRISDVGRPKQLSEMIYKQMAEMTILVTHLVVEFAKRLPGFQTLLKEDQIILLKASASEVMILRTARRYDIETDTIIFADGTPYTRENMRFGGLTEWVDDMFIFCRTMGRMGVDNAEYALLTAICIFEDRPGLVDPKHVEEIQSLYVSTLSAYDSLRRSRATQHFAKLLVKLTDLRTLSASHKDILFSLKVEKGSLPPLLSEYFDVI